MCKKMWSFSLWLSSAVFTCRSTLDENDRVCLEMSVCNVLRAEIQTTDGKVYLKILTRWVYIEILLNSLIICSLFLGWILTVVEIECAKKCGWFHFEHQVHHSRVGRTLIKIIVLFTHPFAMFYEQKFKRRIQKVCLACWVYNFKMKF